MRLSRRRREGELSAGSLHRYLPPLLSHYLAGYRRNELALDAHAHGHYQ